jgi:hypothetical protein
MPKSVFAIVGTSRVQPRSRNAPTRVSGPPVTRGNDRNEMCIATGEPSSESSEIASASTVRVTGSPVIYCYLTCAPIGALETSSGDAERRVASAWPARDPHQERGLRSSRPRSRMLDCEADPFPNLDLP